MDHATAFTRLLLHALGAGHPIRLFIGVSLAFLMKTVIAIPATMPEAAFVWIALNQYSVAWYIVIITPVLFIPVIWGSHGATEASVQQAKTIEMLLDRAGIKGQQRRMFWISFIDRYIKALKPDLSEAPSMRKIAEETISEIKGD